MNQVVCGARWADRDISGLLYGPEGPTVYFMGPRGQVSVLVHKCVSSGIIICLILCHVLCQWSSVTSLFPTFRFFLVCRQDIKISKFVYGSRFDYFVPFHFGSTHSPEPCPYSFTIGLNCYMFMFTIFCGSEWVCEQDDMSLFKFVGQFIFSVFLSFVSWLAVAITCWLHILEK